jgi:hypothetical protein
VAGPGHIHATCRPHRWSDVPNEQQQMQLSLYHKQRTLTVTHKRALLDSQFEPLSTYPVYPGRQVAGFDAPETPHPVTSVLRATFLSDETVWALSRTTDCARKYLHLHISIPLGFQGVTGSPLATSTVISLTLMLVSSRY